MKLPFSISKFYILDFGATHVRVLADTGDLLYEEKFQPSHCQSIESLNLKKMWLRLTKLSNHCHWNKDFNLFPKRIYCLSSGHISVSLKDVLHSFFAEYGFNLMLLNNQKIVGYSGYQKDSSDKYYVDFGYSSFRWFNSLSDQSCFETEGILHLCQYLVLAIYEHMGFETDVAQIHELLCWPKNGRQFLRGRENGELVSRQIATSFLDEQVSEWVNSQCKKIFWKLRAGDVSISRIMALGGGVEIDLLKKTFEAGFKTKIVEPPRASMFLLLAARNWIKEKA